MENGRERKKERREDDDKAIRIAEVRINMGANPQTVELDM